jgi:hypothetical protein
MNRKDYPENWDEISGRIRERAHHACEECGVPNHTWIVRRTDNLSVWEYAYGENGYLGEDGWTAKPIYVVLTVAHYPDPDPMNCEDDNLHCLCQYHHLTKDKDYHAANARKTRIAKNKAQKQADGQLDLFEE